MPLVYDHTLSSHFSVDGSATVARAGAGGYPISAQALSAVIENLADLFGTLPDGYFYQTHAPGEPDVSLFVRSSGTNYSGNAWRLWCYTDDTRTTKDYSAWEPYAFFPQLTAVSFYPNPDSPRQDIYPLVDTFHGTPIYYPAGSNPDATISYGTLPAGLFDGGAFTGPAGSMGSFDFGFPGGDRSIAIVLNAKDPAPIPVGTFGTLALSDGKTARVDYYPTYTEPSQSLSVHLDVYLWADVWRDSSIPPGGGGGGGAGLYTISAKRGQLGFSRTLWVPDPTTGILQMRSSNDWDATGTDLSTGISGISASLLIASDSTQYVATSTSTGALGLYRRFGDSGSFFTMTIPVAGYEPELFESGNVLFCFYHTTAPGTTGDVRVIRSFDGGLTWEGATYLVVAGIPSQRVSVCGSLSALRCAYAVTTPAVALLGVTSTNGGRSFL